MAPNGIGTEVEGIHAVSAALAAGRVLRLTVEASRKEALSELIADARSREVTVAFADDVRDLAVTSAPQGVVAQCRPVVPVDLAYAVQRRTPAALVVLDHLEDPRNVGAVARSAVAAGFTGMVMSTHRSAPLSATSFKSAAGAFEHLDLVVVSSVADCIEQLRRMDVWSVGLDSGGDQQLFGLSLLTEPVAVVIGAEGAGLSRLVAERCDVVAEIPIDPKVESLNASVAAALALFEVARVRLGDRLLHGVGVDSARGMYRRLVMVGLIALLGLSACAAETDPALTIADIEGYWWLDYWSDGRSDWNIEADGQMLFSSQRPWIHIGPNLAGNGGCNDFGQGVGGPRVEDGRFLPGDVVFTKARCVAENGSDRLMLAEQALQAFLWDRAAGGIEVSLWNLGNQMRWSGGGVTMHFFKVDRPPPADGIWVNPPQE